MGARRVVDRTHREGGIVMRAASHAAGAKWIGAALMMGSAGAMPARRGSRRCRGVTAAVRTIMIVRCGERA